MRWAVFFDRDGVLTEAPVAEGVAGSPRSAADLVLLPGAADAVAMLRDLDARVFVVTNQPDVTRGTLDAAEVAAMHDRLRAQLPVDDVRVCPHDGHDACACRKPRPGMLVDLARGWDVDLAASWLVGDRWVDIAAGTAAGTTTILVERSYSWSPTSAGAPDRGLAPDFRVDDVLEAARLIARMPASPEDRALASRRAVPEVRE